MKLKKSELVLLAMAGEPERWWTNPKLVEVTNQVRDELGVPGVAILRVSEGVYPLKNKGLVESETRYAEHHGDVSVWRLTEKGRKLGAKMRDDAMLDW